jgi:hypothetical protein
VAICCLVHSKEDVEACFYFGPGVLESTSAPAFLRNGGSEKAEEFWSAQNFSVGPQSMERKEWPHSFRRCSQLTHGRDPDGEGDERVSCADTGAQVTSEGLL